MEFVDLDSGSSDRDIGEPDWDDTGVRFDIDELDRDEDYAMSVTMLETLGAWIDNVA